MNIYIYQSDNLSVIIEAYMGINLLLNTRQNGSKTMKHFESRYAVQVAKFNSMYRIKQIPECTMPFMILKNYDIDDKHRVSVLASAAPSNADLESQ